MKKNRFLSFQKWIHSGIIFIYLNAAAISFSILFVLLIIGIIFYYGLLAFVPKSVFKADYITKQENQKILGEFVDYETDLEGNITKYLIKTGNRDILGLDFRWLENKYLKNIEYDKNIFVAERREWGNLYGYLKNVYKDSTQKRILTQKELWKNFYDELDKNKKIYLEIKNIENQEISSINYKVEKLNLRKKRLILDNKITKQKQQKIDNQLLSFQKYYTTVQKKLDILYQKLNQTKVLIETVDGKEREILLSSIVHLYRPNDLSFFDKVFISLRNLYSFLTEEPREANTEGGIFPAIFGTVMMVLLMSILVTPLGILTAIYLREYAKQNFLTRLIRISVNNLAGVPSIVYGVFGLGFFIYTIGGKIDEIFYYEALPSPTYGTGGILWSSLTLALLTVPVVIVATEEGLSRIPKNLKEGSFALGATKIETILKIILPMASPSIMTGIILAIARAAGEVAPLMLVGVVKLAPSFPIDSNFPFFHLDRKFMHLGFHIYDLGFQSPNVEASRPLLYATALFLILIVIILNLSVVIIRNHLRERYKSLEN